MAPRIKTNMHGFTLVELVMVIVITGVLAVAVVPRFFDRGMFDSQGLYEETRAILRYAQKAAIAQRRTVCVAFTANSTTLTIVQAAESNNCSSVHNLAGPTGVSPYRIEGKRGAEFATTPAALMFTALGQPLDAAGAALPAGGRSITVRGAGTITIEQETGYVR